EIGTDYEYTFSSDGGGTDVTDNGQITSVDQQVGPIDLSGLGDGTISLSVTLSNDNGDGAEALDQVTKITEIPSGYTVSIDQDPIISSNMTAVSFTFSDAEVGATYNYTFSSDAGVNVESGSGTIATGTHQVTGIDLSGLLDGTITLSVTLSNDNGVGAAALDQVTKITEVPSGYTVSIDQDPIITSNMAAVGFTFSGAELGAGFEYTFSSDGGVVVA